MSQPAEDLGLRRCTVSPPFEIQFPEAAPLRLTCNKKWGHDGRHSLHLEWTDRTPEPITNLRPAVAQAIAELDAEHRESQVGGCSVCLPSLGWPCISRMIADNLRVAISEKENESD